MFVKKILNKIIIQMSLDLKKKKKLFEEWWWKLFYVRKKKIKVNEN